MQRGPGRPSLGLAGAADRQPHDARQPLVGHGSGPARLTDGTATGRPEASHASRRRADTRQAVALGWRFLRRPAVWLSAGVVLVGLVLGLGIVFHGITG